jgi:hypothetical protein
MKLFHSSRVPPAEMRGGTLLPIDGVLWLSETPYASTTKRPGEHSAAGTNALPWLISRAT